MGTQPKFPSKSQKNAPHSFTFAGLIFLLVEQIKTRIRLSL